jgi:prevent-host-death family protein
MTTVHYSSLRGNYMEEVAISEFKAKCLALLEQVRKTKKPIRVTRFGKPVAEVIPPTPSAEPADWLGSMAGTIEIVGDIVSPVAEPTDWEALRD